jgi:hypothetical protein
MTIEQLNKLSYEITSCLMDACKRLGFSLLESVCETVFFEL